MFIIVLAMLGSTSIANAKTNKNTDTQAKSIWFLKAPGTRINEIGNGDNDGVWHALDGSLLPGKDSVISKINQNNYYYIDTRTDKLGKALVELNTTLFKGEKYKLNFYYANNNPAVDVKVYLTNKIPEKNKETEEYI
ncbi:hypothetical protein, partial [Fusobacterium sp.]|uniref:hypothetical protein n=1 Tax=Fusobacterium sp. TaxID=68766 RepID=UPI0025BF2F16